MAVSPRARLSRRPLTRPHPLPKKPKAGARRLSVFHRRIELGLSATALELVFAAPRVVSEGELDGDRYVGSTTSQELVARQATRRNSALEEVRFGSARAIIDDLQVRCDNASGEPDRPVIQSGDEVVFRFRILSSERIADVVLGISLSKTMGGDIWGDNNLNAGVRIDLPAGVTEVEYRARLPISAGEDLIHCGLARFDNDSREELDQRRGPMRKLTIWSPRSQVGVVHAPVNVNVRAGGAT